MRAARPAAAVVDQLPLARTTLTVRNTARAAVDTMTPPTPVVYVMPAPMVDGLDQPRSGTPVAFGTAAGTGTGGQASFGTSVGATVSATIGDPTFAALQLTASAERATRTTDGTETTQVSSQTINNNLNQALVVYTVTPVWQWTGSVVADSTGIGTTNAVKVLTQIAKRTGTTKPVLEGRSVAELARTTPTLFGADGTYGPTLISVFGPGVFGGTGRTVTGADPGAYPTFSTAGSLAPRVDGTPYCDTPGGTRGVTSINSGVPSPYTEPDVTAKGPAYLTSSDAPVRVGVGDGVSNELQVTVASTATTSYSTDFSVNTSAGVSIGGVGASVDAGFTIGNQTSVSTTTSQTFAAEIGSIRGATGSGLDQALVDQITDALRSEQYSWEPFMCRRTTSLPGGGQTAALVLGFATAGFTGLNDVGTTGTPVGITGSASAGSAPVVAQGSVLRLTRSGPAATYQVLVQGPSSSNVRTLSTPVLTPAAPTALPATTTVRLPTGLPAGRYSWRPSAISFNGVTVTGAPRYFTVR